MERKDFIKLSGLGVVGLMSTNSLFGQPLSYVFKSSIDDLKYDALVIGTGYGAAVCALRMGLAGKKVLMLEMGLDWAKSNLTFSKMAWAEKQSTWLRNHTIAPFGNFRRFKKFTGVLDRMDFNNIKVYAGRGVGGGSLANGGMSVTPKKNYFEEIFPELNSDKFYDNYFPLANNELGVNDMPDDIYDNSDYYEFSRVGEREAKKAGFKTVKVPNVYDFGYMRREELGEVPKSGLGGGEVIYGNNHGKKDLTKTYLKKARATNNVTILELHKAEQIIDNNDGTYAVKISQINTSGEIVNTKFLKTDKLFLGAGSLGTTELLLKSKAEGTLPNLNDEVGKHWANNGNCMSGRNFIKGGTGNVQSSIPAVGVDNWDDKKHSFFTEIAPLPIGIETYAGLYLTINRTPKLGSIFYDKAKAKIDLVWDSSHTKHMVDNAKYFVDEMNKANGGTYARLLFNRGIGEDICYHPLGGAVIGKATDLYGRLKGLPGIYVMDGSLVPGSIGVNPYVTITALAEHCIEDIIKKDFVGTGVDDDLIIVSSNNGPVAITEDINVFPVSFSDSINIGFKHPLADDEVAIYVYSMSGYKLKSKKFKTKEGANKFQLHGLWFLPKGFYVMKIIIGGNIYTKNIQK